MVLALSLVCMSTLLVLILPYHKPLKKIELKKNQYFLTIVNQRLPFLVLPLQDEGLVVALVGGLGFQFFPLQ